VDLYLQRVRSLDPMVSPAFHGVLPEA
jgi:hypothetical protein